MNKKGQFFLIAALVIAGIIITLGAINISTKKIPNEEKPFYDLSKEIDYESNQLIDYGVYESQTFSERNKSLVSFVSNYSAANPNTEMLLIYGNASLVTILFYTSASSGAPGISTGGSPAEVPQRVIVPTVPIYEKSGNNITVMLSENSVLTFELQAGENFFIVLKKESGEETFVAKE